ncbi:hypothetical protein ACJX0J_002096 (mitochondrion) [Zea mays]
MRLGSGLLTWLHNNQLIEIHNPLVEYKPTEVFFSILRDHWDDLVNIGLGKIDSEGSALVIIPLGGDCDKQEWSNPSGKEKLYLHNESAVSDHLFDLFAISNIEGWPVTGDVQ